MAITVEPQKDGRDLSKGDQPRVRRKYWIQGTADDDTAEAYLDSYTDNTVQGYPKIHVRVKAHEVNVSTPNTSVWDGEVIWEDQNREATTGRQESRFSASMTGGTIHKGYSLKTLNSYSRDASTDPPPNFNKAIGVTNNGGELDIEGVDVPTSQFTPSETHWKPASDVWGSYITTLEDLSATVNNAPFRGREAGEVLFLGPSSMTYVEGSDGFEITYDFRVTPNVTNQTIGDITGIDKRGHDALWVYYKTEEDANGNKVKVPAYVYTEQVFEYRDLGRLEIGT